MSWAQKQPKLQDFITKMRTRAFLIPNSNHETRKSRIQQGFITKKKPNKAITRKCTQTRVEHTKCNGEFYLYLYLLDLIERSFSISF